jgi:2-keto-3-deoxy-L-rhamnonate aldolase RhmA
VPVAINHTKQKLNSGRVVLGLGVRQFRSVEIGLIARAAGFDFLFLDQEHGTMDLTTHTPSRRSSTAVPKVLPIPTWSRWRMRAQS